MAKTIEAEQSIDEASWANVNHWVPHDIVLQNAWFPLAHSHAVGSKPVRRSVHSRPYFLWREAGTVIGAPCLPGMEATLPASSHYDRQWRHKIIERYGYIWGWFGEHTAADPVHLPNVPFLPPSGGLPGYMRGSIRFDCSASLSLENLIDQTHADFLHASLFGDEKSDHETLEVCSDSETITMIRTCYGKSVAPMTRFFAGIRQSKQDVQEIIRVYVRSSCAIAYARFQPGDDVPLFHPCLPESRNRNRADFTINTTHSRNLFRYVIAPASYIVASQDSWMTRPQSPRYMLPTRRRDLHSKFDKPGQVYRQCMQTLAARQAKGDFAYQTNLSADCREEMGLRRDQFRY